MSSIVTRDWLAAGDWVAIRRAAAEAAGLAPELRAG
jgi:hypothetical protein